ncbi:MAG: hypothetical protein A3D31_12210 [Candidatus Fluviicola riflensis]|nr:MAG: hypothetical protein CHH17_16645 [Candidatus Fluviicola riflensis]OGS77749.1 MAG: hypothetical protein A3D31_12210 [Candidatus Fluviicola riflensis]OGS84332.1 MAG: hypothetical protein A3E30_13620 [Fluviicola sp. RIFCSPHIGHO2_12_FULL_43_24]OGS84814.1 MAG: hypothetical protein A2724_09145 [Fluviicola sp. RIFCSPHIGHO2_01_FULL_43_53]
MNYLLLALLLFTGSFSLVAAPEINVTGNSITITDGDLTPDLADFTDFGNQSICAGITTLTFTIENMGPDPLSVGSIMISGVDAGEFSVVLLPASNVAPGGTTTFQIAFDPSSVGLKSAVITINNDDSDEAAYDFAIQGTATDPEITITGNGNTINDGNPTPSGSNHTGFGPVLECIGTVTRTYTISNSGTGNLVIDAGGITLTGTHAFDYTIGGISLPASISAGGNTTFTVTSDPSGTGNRLATVNIANNDCSEAVYDFAIQTNGQADATGPVAPTLATVTDECSVTLSVPTATDNCAGAVSGTTSTVFPVTTQGTTVVTWTFNDGNGNSSTATQTITIADTTSPAIPTLANVTGECSETLLPPVTTDNCAGVITGTTSTVFPITTQGTTTVTWLFDDGNGNTATATQDVTLTDTIDPVVSNCPATITETVNSANCSAVVSWTPPSVTDNCVASPGITASHNPGAIFPLGTTPVTYTFVDENGNSAVCAFDVMVISDLNATATVDVNGASIMANNSSGTYQWINCATMAVIPGAITQTFFPSVNGNYAVIVTENGCSDTSACVNVFAVGVNELAENTVIYAFPNPSGGLFYLSSSVPLVKLELVDLSGKKLLEETLNFQQIDLSDLQNGVYLLRVTTIEKQEKILRLVKE